MKKIYITLLLCVFLFSVAVFAQERNDEKSKLVNIIVIDQESDRAIVGFPNAKVEVQEHNDTITKITLGHKRFEFIEHGSKTDIRMVRIPRDKFKGHYSGVQLGFCNYSEPDYDNSLPSEYEYMELNAGKSMVFSVNFLQYDIGLQKNNRNIGLVTGLGWSVYNYRLDNQYYLQVNEQGDTYGEAITDDTVEKNKIVTSFVNIPLMFEAQIPSSLNRSTAYVSAGMYGGFKIGSHTKTVLSGNDKSKSRDNINLNPLQYGAMFQIGYKFIKLYGTYNFSGLFENDNGPELYPYSVGVTLVNF